MEIKIKKGNIYKALLFTQNVVARKSTMPILANVLLDAKGKTLRISATDLEVGISVDCPSDVLQDGKVTVFASRLFDIVRELPDDLIYMKTLENNYIKLSCGKSDFKIAGMAAAAFPPLLVGKGADVHIEERDSMAAMISKVSFAMSTDENRQILNGIYFQSVEKGGKAIMRMVATDGHRLAISDRPAKGRWKAGTTAIIPRKGVMELKKVLDEYHGDISLSISEKDLTVEKENVKLVVRLIDGQFPPYEQVIPKSAKRVITVGRELLEGAISRVSLLANEKTMGVKMLFSPGHLEISTSNPDVGEAKEDLDIGYKGETFSTAFNARYFMDVLGVLEDENVVIELNDDVNPCVIRSEFDKGLLNVIMPMRM